MRVSDGNGSEYEFEDLPECICSACGAPYRCDELKKENEYGEYWGAPYTRTVVVTPCCGEAATYADELKIIEE